MWYNAEWICHIRHMQDHQTCRRSLQAYSDVGNKNTLHDGGSCKKGSAAACNVMCYGTVRAEGGESRHISAFYHFYTCWAIRWQSGFWTKLLNTGYSSELKTAASPDRPECPFMYISGRTIAETAPKTPKISAEISAYSYRRTPPIIWFRHFGR